jgi:hypothetical protein
LRRFRLDNQFARIKNESMDRATYEALKRRAEEARQRAEEEYRQDLAALERVWALAQANGVSTATATASVVSASQSGSRPKHPPKIGRGKALSEVRAAVQNFSGNFDFKDVLETISVDHPSMEIKQGTVNAALKSLTKKGEIQVVNQGIGRKPTTYRRKEE